MANQEDDYGSYQPDHEEIQLRLAEIQARWTEELRDKRRVGGKQTVEIMVIEVAAIERAGRDTSGGNQY